LSLDIRKLIGVSCRGESQHGSRGNEDRFHVNPPTQARRGG
jgi:hypothetical protein